MKLAHTRSPLLIGNVVLLLALVWMSLGDNAEIEWPVGSIREMPKEKAPEPLQPPKSSMEQVEVVWQRPLFSPSRTPDAARASAAPDQLVGLTLTGTAAYGENQWAFLRLKDDRSIKIKVNDSLQGGWTLSQVTPNSATFKRNGQTQVISIPVRRLPAPSPLLKLPLLPTR